MNEWPSNSEFFETVLSSNSLTHEPLHGLTVVTPQALIFLLEVVVTVEIVQSFPT